MPELKLVNSLVDNRYEVRERLGRGSYAEIFVAYDRELQRDVVIKALNTSLQGTPDADLERTLIENFQNEAMALDAVRHPNVILRWGHGTAADLRGTPFHYLVVEYMPGGDLLRLCRSNPGNALKIDRALVYFKQICEALAYAHSKGIIHRDLKPNNFLLSADRSTVKVADFGVAKMTTGEDSEITRVGADVYAPPEHHPGEPESQINRLTAAADTYSLAKSFYTVVFGRAPNQFSADPITYLPDQAIDESWAGPLLAVLKRATDDVPDKRYSTVVEFWNDLSQVVPISELVEEEEEAANTEETIVRPRLNVNPGQLPNKPEEPEFDPTLASVRSHATYTSATPVRRRENIPDVGVVEKDAPENTQRPSKVVIELQQPKPSPIVQTQANHQPAAKKEAQQPASRNGKQKKASKQVAERFTQSIRRRVFIGLMVLAIIGSLVSVYKFVSGRAEPIVFGTIGFGPPTEVVVAIELLNVRSEPSGRSRDTILGTVERGTRHRVLARTETGWIQIEVRQWSLQRPHVNDADRGWVDSNYVNVVSRRWW